MTKEEGIDKQIVDLLKTLSLGPNTTEWLKSKLKESHQDEVKFREDALRNLNNTFGQTRNRLDKVYDDKLDGFIDEETYHRKREELLGQQADITDQIKKHTIADEKYVDFGCLVLDVANRASEIYQVRKPEEKKYLCNLVFSNLFLADKTVKFSLNTIFQAVLQYQETKDWLGILESDLWIKD